MKEKRLSCPTMSIVLSPAITDIFMGLYGSNSQNELNKLEVLVNEARSRLAAPEDSLPPNMVTERDALLITYADQLRGPGFSPLEELRLFANSHLQGVVNGVHLLPFYPSTSDDGFAVSDYLAVDPDIGNWDAVRQIGRDFDLMLDGVFNHMSAGSAWFRAFLANDPRFCDFFVEVHGNPDLSAVVRPRALPLLTEFLSPTGPRKIWTTFSADQVDLNFKNPAVLTEILKLLFFYIEQGARFIRLDAIAFLWKEPGTSCLHLRQTHRVIQLMRAVLDQVAPHVRLITETNVPHKDNVSYFGNGQNEAQLVYNFALPPLVLHSISSGEATTLSSWAKTLNTPGDQVTFFNFLASHDGIGLNPARGILPDQEIEGLIERTLRHGGYISWKNLPDGSRSPYEMNINYFDACSNPSSTEPLALQVKRFLCAHAIMLALPGVPGVYFHSLFGSRGDRAGAESSGIPRRINRQKLQRSTLEAELAHTGSLRHAVFTGLKTLLQARHRPAFHPAAPCEILDLDPRVFAVRRTSLSGTQPVLCLQNVSGETVHVKRPAKGRWQRFAGTTPEETGFAEETVLNAFEFAWGTPA